MTITPNNKKKPENLKVERAPDGIYTITNAYEGEYEYFKDRPLPKIFEK